MTIIGTYDPYLVALSIAVACLASYTALDLGGRISRSRRWPRLAWLATAATAVGDGIWSMHFIGMLAFIVPMPVSYDFSLTLLSLVVAIGVTGFGFFMIGTRRVTALEFVLSGIFMGIGIAAMHYTGMAAMRMPADVRYDRVLVALSVVIAIGASIPALWLAFRTTLAWQRLLAAAVMGSAISGMHYTGMAAATFIGAPGTDGARGVPVLAQADLALAIATITFVILLLALVASAFDRKLTRLAEEVRFQATFENAAVGMAHVAPDGRWLRVNEALCRIVGYPADELITRSFQDITHPDDLAGDLAQVNRMLDGKIDSYGIDKRYLRKDGSVVWVRLTVGAVRKSEGSIDYFVGVVENISARKQAEQALQASKDRLQLALDAAQLGSFQYDRGRRVLAWDGRCKEIFDIAEDEVQMEDLVNLVHPDDTEMVWAFINAPLHAPAQPDAFEHRILRGGEVRWVEVHRLAYFEDAGHGLRSEHDVGTVQDITEPRSARRRSSFSCAKSITAPKTC